MNSLRIQSFRSLFLVALAAVTVLLTVSATDVQAKRIGAGRSTGKQSQSVPNRDAAPRDAANPNAAATTTQSQAAAASVQASNTATRSATNTATNMATAATSGAAASAAVRPRNAWLGPVAGLAAGLGLAALASHLGLGEELASFMMIMLALMVALFALRWFIARRAAAAGGTRRIITPSFAYSGIGQEACVPHFQAPLAGSATRFEPSIVRPSGSTAALLGATVSAGGRIPVDFDGETFLRQAREQYIRLQGAYDSADFATLRNFSSADMYAQLKAEIEQRAGATNHTDVVSLHAELLGIDSSARDHTASVRFYGVLRESAEQSSQSFDEVWNLLKPVDGSAGWVLAGIQQLQ